MTKLPFGGFDAGEPLIDDRDDPAPLLAEIAQCAMAGTKMRPALASWFHRTWEQNRISVRKPSGAPGISKTRLVDVVLRAEEMMRGLQGDGWDGATFSGEVIRKAFKLEGIKATRNVFYRWHQEVVAARKVEG